MESKSSGGPGRPALPMIQDTSGKEAFAAALEKLANVFGRKLTPEVIVTYWESLSGYGLDVFLRACRYVLDNTTDSRDFPLPGKFREIIRSFPPPVFVQLPEPEVPAGHRVVNIITMNWMTYISGIGTMWVERAKEEKVLIGAKDFKEFVAFAEWRQPDLYALGVTKQMLADAWGAVVALKEAGDGKE